MLAVISITNRCNMMCKMCDIGQKNFESAGLTKNLLEVQKELTVEEWDKALDKLKVNEVHIVGVEPLLYKDFDLLIKTIKKNRMLHLITNGLLVDKYFDTIRKYFNLVTISVDGLKESHDKIRGIKGSFEKSDLALDNLKKLNRRVRVSFAITPDNTKDIIPFYNYFNKKKIEIVFNHYNFIHPDVSKKYTCGSTNFSYYNPLDVDIRDVHKAILNCKNSSWLPNLKSFEELEKYYRTISTCKKPGSCKVFNDQVLSKRVIISSDGSFIPGNRCWYTKPMGNILDMKLLPKDTQWIKDEMIKFKREGLPEPCHRLCCAGKIL